MTGRGTLVSSHEACIKTQTIADLLSTDGMPVAPAASQRFLIRGCVGNSVTTLYESLVGDLGQLAGPVTSNLQLRTLARQPCRLDVYCRWIIAHGTYG